MLEWDNEECISRKERKQERKLLRSKDRSKYKKTDQKKKKVEHGELGTNVVQAVVLSIGSNGMNVRTSEGKHYLCSLRGVLKKEKALEKNLVIVGDDVVIEPLSEQEAVIISVLPRRSLLSRQDNLHRIKRHLIAANVDVVFITQSCVFPALKPPIIDRYLIAAEKGGITPVLVFNKIDLLEGHPEERLLVEQCKQVYESLGICVLLVSAKTQEGLDALRYRMSGVISVFSGQSGTGKTSLINAVTGLSLMTAPAISATNKGSHTTTSAKLLELSWGGFCVDTPGIRSFGIWDLDPEDLKHYFADFFAQSQACAFSDCSHRHEPDCRVKELVETGILSPLRYASYVNLYESIQEEHRLR